MNTSDGGQSSVTTSDIILSVVMAPVFLFFYTFVLAILIMDRKAFRNPYYSLTMGLGLCQMAMLLRYVYTFIISYNGFYVFGEIFDNFMGTLAWSVGWHSVLTYQIFICLNRFVAIIFYDRYRRLFTRNITAALVAFCYTSGVLTVGPLLFRHKIRYDFKLKYNLLVPEDESTNRFYFFDMIFTIFAGCTVVVLYFTAIIFTKYKLRRPSMSVSRLRNGFMKEVKLMSEGFLVALTLVCQEVTFYFKMDTVITLTLMLLHAGMTPFIYLTLDQKLRKYFFAYLQCQCGKKAFAFVELNSIRRFSSSQRTNYGVWITTQWYCTCALAVPRMCNNETVHDINGTIRLK